MNKTNVFASIFRQKPKDRKKSFVLDLARSDYAGLELANLDFNYANLSGTNFSDANLHQSSLMNLLKKSGDSHKNSDQ